MSVLARSPWRLAARLARRELGRRRARMVLVVLLVALPVAAMTLGAAFIRSNTASGAPDAVHWFEDQYGIGADVGLSGGDALADAELPAGWQAWRSQLASVPLLVDGGAFDVHDPPWVELVETVQPDRFGRLIDGAVPARRGEVTVDAGFARRFDLAVGDVLDARYLGPLEIVGIVNGRRDAGTRLVGVDLPLEAVRDPWNRVSIDVGGDGDGIGPFLSEQAIEAGLTTFDPGDVSLSVAPWVPRFEVLDYSFGGDPDAWAPENGDAGPLAVNWMLGVVGLGVVGIIIAAAFAAGTARQVVTSGQLLANGASPGLVRRVLALQGTWAGLVGAVLGIGGGVAFVWLFLARSDWAERNFTELYVWVIRPLDLVVIGLTGVAAATIAALVPARLLAGIPVLSALAGRRPVRPAPRRLVPIGIGASASGTALLVTSMLASRSTSDGWLPGLTGGVGGLLVVIGMIGVSPVVIGRAADLAARLGPSWRLAARSIGRNRFRSTAVVAVIGVALTVTVGVSALAVGSIDPPGPMDLAVVVDTPAWSMPDENDGLVDLPAPSTPGWLASARAALEAEAPDAAVIDLRYVVTDPPPRHDESFSQRLLIADPALVARLGLSDEARATLDEFGAIDLNGAGGISDDAGGPTTVTLEDESGAIAVTLTPVAGRTPFEFDASVLVSPARAADLGLAIVTQGLLIDGDGPFTEAERQAIWALDDDVRAGDYYLDAGPPSAGGRRWASVPEPAIWTPSRAQLVTAFVGFLVAGIVVAIGLSLTSAEGRPERAVLAALGAAPSTRRRTSAAQAALLTLIAAVLAIPTALVPLAVLDVARSRTSDWAAGDHLVGMPWLTVVAVIAVLPPAAAAGAWLASALGTLRPQPTPIARLALD
ncbi:MAG: FtsX-like permease family protein [Desertimonas sp.]